MKNNNEINVEKLKMANDRVAMITNVLQLQVDLFNFVSHPKDVPQDALLLYYHSLYTATDNLHELNQNIINDLNDLSAVIDEEIDKINSRLNK